MLIFFEKQIPSSVLKSIETKIYDSLRSDNIEKYSQTMSELIVLYYVCRSYGDSFTYEPKYNGNYNPECCFSCGGFTVNIEVKCPNYAERNALKNRNTLKIDLIGQRLPDKKVLEEVVSMLKPNISNTPYNDIEVKKLMDMKLKDFLEHSNKKFPKGDEYFNILVISLETITDLDEWYMYLFGDNGVFTTNSFLFKNSYSNVDAIILSTIRGKLSPSLEKKDNRWYMENADNYIFLDPEKEHSNKGTFFFDSIINMFGSQTLGFLKYQTFLDGNNEDNTDAVSYYIHKSRMFSNYYNYIANSRNI